MNEIEAKVKAALEEFWDERAIPSGPAGETIVNDLIGPVESMTAVDVLVTVDEIVGFKLPSSVIQAGGYQTKSEFVTRLSAAVMTRVATKSAK